jgi:hypothetical protein
MCYLCTPLPPFQVGCHLLCLSAAATYFKFDCSQQLSLVLSWNIKIWRVFGEYHYEHYVCGTQHAMMGVVFFSA